MKVTIEFIDHNRQLAKFYIIAFFIATFILFAFMLAQANEINLEIIAKIESSNNPLAYNTRSQARGLYQITPICLKDYNQQNGLNLPVNALFNPSTSHTIAKWYLEARIPLILQNKGIPVTVDTVLWAYNAGVGKVIKGIMPNETRNYIKKYKQLARRAK